MSKRALPTGPKATAHKMISGLVNSLPDVDRSIVKYYCSQIADGLLPRANKAAKMNGFGVEPGTIAKVATKVADLVAGLTAIDTKKIVLEVLRCKARYIISIAKSAAAKYFNKKGLAQEEFEPLLKYYEEGGDLRHLPIRESQVETHNEARSIALPNVKLAVNEYPAGTTYLSVF